MNKAAREIMDPVFGLLRLEQDAIWIGRASLAPFGEVGVRIDRRDDSPPDDRQRAIFKAYSDRWQALLPLALQRVAALCASELRPIYVDIFEADELEEVLPSDLDAGWVVRNVSQAEIAVPPDAMGIGGTPLDLSIFWECTWDPEHGVGVSFADASIIDVGQQAALG
jgi:hypothetical protein